MKDSEKINEIGKMLADIQAEVKFLRIKVDKIWTHMSDPHKLDTERYLNKILHDSVKPKSNKQRTR